MEAIWSYLKTVKLSLSQYTQILSAMGIGVLVVALKIKSDQLHTARIQLLKQAHAVEEQKADDAVAKATKNVSNSRARYVQAIDDYRSHLNNTSK